MPGDAETYVSETDEDTFTESQVANLFGDNPTQPTRTGATLEDTGEHTEISHCMKLPTSGHTPA